MTAQGEQQDPPMAGQQSGAEAGDSENAPGQTVQGFLGYDMSAFSSQDLSTGAGAAPACLATILPSTMTINVGTA